MKKLLLLIPPAALCFSGLAFFGLPNAGLVAGALAVPIAIVGVLNALVASRLELAFWAVLIETVLHLLSAALLVFAGWTVPAALMSVAVLADLRCIKYAK